MSAGWTQQLSAFPTTCSSRRKMPCNSFNSILLQSSQPTSVTQTCHWPILLKSWIYLYSCIMSFRPMIVYILSWEIQTCDLPVIWTLSVMTPWLHWPHIWHCGWLFRQCPHSLSGEWRLCAQWQASGVSKCPESGWAGKMEILRQFDKNPSACTLSCTVCVVDSV